MAVIVSKGIVIPSYAPPVGTTWLYENNGTFEVPADGIYQVEMHGGGGGGGGGTHYNHMGSYFGSGGGGSGTVLTLPLNKGDSCSIIIGAGGAGGSLGYEEPAGRGSQGGTTTFGDYSIAGGGGGSGAGTYNSPYEGSSSGNLATAGKCYDEDGAVDGGYGNKNNTAQTYGNGGAGGYDFNKGSDGKPGAVIITFMGVA